MGKLTIPDWMRPVVIMILVLLSVAAVVFGTDWSMPFRLLVALGTGVLVAIVLDSIIEKR